MSSHDAHLILREIIFSILKHVITEGALQPRHIVIGIHLAGAINLIIVLILAAVVHNDVALPVKLLMLIVAIVTRMVVILILFDSLQLVQEFLILKLIKMLVLTIFGIGVI